jgi:hypothetical protein
MPGLVHCARYRCALEEKACARRYTLAQLDTKRDHIALCKGCVSGAERAAEIDVGEMPKNARTLPLIGRGTRK